MTPPADSTATPPRLLIVRHGQSEWNAVRRWQGTADPPLTELGRHQARQAAEQLRDLTDANGQAFSAIWSSDLVRAAETAEIIADVLGIGRVTLDGRLEEAHAGEWEGLTPIEIEEQWPGWLEANRRPPLFEPFDQVVARVVQALDEIAASTASALVVSHSGVIRSLVRWSGATDVSVPNLGGRWLRIDPVGGVDPAAVSVVGEFAPDLARTGESMPENPVATMQEPHEQRHERR